MRRLAAIGFVLTALVAAAPAAAANGTLKITNVNTSHFPTVRVTVQSTGSGGTPRVSLLENGKPATNATTSDGGAQVAIALLIDTSKSMTGSKLPDAIAAAKQFVKAQKQTTVVGLYGFGDQVFQAAPIDQDRTQVATALDQLALSAKAGTDLYAALSQASTDLNDTHAQQKIAVLLTDGESQNDSATITDAISAATRSGVTVYPIGIATDGKASAALQQIASQTGGSFSTVTDSSALADVYNGINDELGSTTIVTYTSLAAAGAPIALKATAPGYAPVQDALKAPGTFDPGSSGGSKLPSGTGGRIGMGLLAALLVALATLFLLGAKPSVVLTKRIRPFTESTKNAAIEAVNPAEERTSALHQLFISTEKIIGSMNWWKKMAGLLEQADLPLRTAELFYIQLGTGLLLGAFVALAMGQQGFIALIALVVGALAPVMVVRFKAKQRLNRFENQLPETLITMAASLKAGHAFNQSMQSVVNEGAEPTAKEFSRVLAEVQLGMSSELALEAMANRMNSYNFGFVVMSVNIQRTVGGSLADILDMVADTVRQRQQFEKKVKALTAQGRMSAYVLLAMPFLMALAIFAINPAYMRILWTSSLGRIMIAIGLVSMSFGALIIRKIVAFKG
jgi:tight adherence protein B